MFGRQPTSRIQPLSSGRRGDWTKEKVYEDRLLALQRFVLVQSPDDWLSLWRDRREPLRFWTLWALIFSGLFNSINILGILQVGLAIAQTVASFED